MVDLTFGEQVKIILSRRGMTIKELAEKIEKETGKKMSRQNLTQRLGRDNFQEQDMRMIAQILGCPFYLDILEEHDEQEVTVGDLIDLTQETQSEEEQDEQEEQGPTRDMLDEKADSEYVQETLFDFVREKEAGSSQSEDPVQQEEAVPETEVKEEAVQEEKPAQEEKKKAHGWRAFFERYMKHEGPEEATKAEPEADSDGKAKKEETEMQTTETLEVESKTTQRDDADMFLAGEEDLSIGELNPYTGHEYESNSVRMHPKRIGYVQVYDRGRHQWTDMTEWAFLGYQERKKALLGKDYMPPIYLD